MEHVSLARTGFDLVTKRTRKREFLDEINPVIPRSELLTLTTPHVGKLGSESNCAQLFQQAAIRAVLMETGLPRACAAGRILLTY